MNSVKLALSLLFFATVFAVFGLQGWGGDWYGGVIGGMVGAFFGLVFGGYDPTDIDSPPAPAYAPTLLSTSEGETMDVQVGDVVQLKSGGPKMTVQHIETEYGVRVHCQWFEGSNLIQGSFPPQSLVKVTDATAA